MMAIFTHTDQDGDSVEVIERTKDTLTVSVAGYMKRRTAQGDLSREAVTRLHAALGEWLFPAYAGTPDTSLLERMVRKAAEDAVSAVLPLAARPGAGHVDVDPEPHDVGHPEAGPTWDDQLWGSVEGPGRAGPCGSVARKGVLLCDPCPGCGYVWALHRAQPDCGCIRGGADIGESCPSCQHWHRTGTRCTAARPVPAPRQLTGCECGHRWGTHRDSRCHAGACTCTRRRADIPEGCECGHGDGLHAVLNGGCTVCGCTRSRGVR